MYLDRSGLSMHLDRTTSITQRIGSANVKSPIEFVAISWIFPLRIQPAAVTVA